MTDELPEGWTECKTGDISQIVGGGTPDARKEENFSTESGIPWLTPADLSGHDGIYVSRGKRFLTKTGFESSSAKLMPMGAVLFSSRAPIGYVAVAANEMSTNQGFKSFVCSDAVIAEYLYFWLKYAKPLAEELASGTTFAEISGTNAAKIPILLPPLPEQLRIAEKLEKLLAEVEQCKERMAKIPVLLKRFRQSVLAAACSGRLTEDWRETEGLDRDQWEEVSIADVADARLGKMLDQSKNTGSPTPYLRNINVRWFGFDLDSLLTMRASDEEKRELAIEDGDLLVCEGGEPGRCAVWMLGRMNLIFQKAIHRIRLKPNVSPYWLAFNIKYDADNGSLEQYFTGSAIKHLTGRSLATYKFSAPPLAEQREIVQRVEALFVVADRIEERYRRAKKQVDSLAQSILAKAFRGELVPTEAELAAREGRDYESAEALLQRIHSLKIDKPEPKGASRNRLRRRDG